jgi:hypothetical protein
MTGARFPHSETPGSQPGCRLPGAYRRLQRPSSAPGAKASTVCPKKLGTTTCTTQQPLSLRRNRRCSRPLCSSQETAAPGPPPPARRTAGRPARGKPRPQAPVPSGPNSVPAPGRPPSPAPRAAHAAGHSRENNNNRDRIASAPQESMGAVPDTRRHQRLLPLRKEVIQPHLPVRLPCYDFVPIADPTFDGSPPIRG